MSTKRTRPPATCTERVPWRVDPPAVDLRHEQRREAGQEDRVTPSFPTPPLALPAPAAVPTAVPVVAAPSPPDRNPAAVYLAGKPSAVGRRGLRRSLERAAEILTNGLTSDALAVNWAEVRYQHVMALKAVLIEDNAKPATINHVLAAVRGVIRDAWRLGLIDAETKERIVDIKSVSASTLPAGRHVGVGEIRRLFETCGATLVGARDAAMLALLYGCGLRRSEAVALLVDDYREGSVTVRTGKGRKERIVYSANGGRAAIDAWIRVRGAWDGALLAPVAKGGRIQQRALTSQAVMLRLQFLGKRAGIDNLSPHDLRRSFVGELLDAGADISAVQQLAGHSSVTTTARYDRRGERAKQRTAELLHVPYTSPLPADAPADPGDAPPPAAQSEPPAAADPPAAGAPG